MFHWFIESLFRQTTAEEREGIQLLFIDRHLWFPGLFHGAKEHTEWIKLDDPKYHDPSRRRYASEINARRFHLTHLPPKPNVYAGPWRLTSKDWFCAANARNTAFLYAAHPYIVCVDDLSVLMPGWWNQAKHAAAGMYCVCGAYKKVLNLDMKLLDEQQYGVTYEPFEAGVDSRWSHGSDTGIVPWTGAGLFGCSFGMPLNLAVRVDGFAPETNGCGAEDYDFGIRAERAGGVFKYNRNMLTLESEERHHTDGTKDNDGSVTALPSLWRERRVVTNRNFVPAGYDTYRLADPLKKFDSDHLLLNRVRNETTRILPLIPEHLAKQRDRLLSDGVVNVPREPLESWIDLKPLKEL